ncbi:pregnancy-specific glycoprotein 22-like [Chaetodon trifascialis]|uniref:pregnancy-specific glycoprotein 22-like n=1 Tax=Chaetodon trifascialis TaxID=109706 RepID=UPI0039918D94
MEAVVGLLLMLLGLCHGVETSCDGRQDGAQCYGPLGGTVVLQLMDDASEIFRFIWSNKTRRILTWRDNKTAFNRIENRSSFTPSNGTFRINDLRWTDGGEYTLTMFDSRGKTMKLLTLQMIVQGVETSCDGRQDGAQCYGPLGGTVVLQLMDDASEIFKFIWSSKTRIILSWRDNKILSNSIADRSSFTPSNGTFIINDLRWTDGGEYTLTMFNSRGKTIELRGLQLSIQGVETSCDGRQDGAQCYGALRGTVVLQLMDDASEIFKFTWSNKTRTILNWRENKILSNQIENRSSFTPSDGTFRINDLRWTDGGEYTLTMFDSKGKIMKLLTLQMIVQGVETSCDGRQEGAQCYGALRGTVVLQLMDDTSEIFKFTWSSKTMNLLTWRENKILSNQIENRSSFTPSNGTFRINDLRWTDGGEYTLTMFDSRGKTMKPLTLQMIVQAPVSSVRLVSECLSQGEMRVSCSSEGGDSPQYSWTLDGHTLTDAQLLSGGNESEDITLKQDVSGQLVCSVSNNVSRVWREETISTCGFAFIDCTLSNGTHISQWVLEANNTLCIKPTTASTTTTEDHSLLILGLRTAVAILILFGIVVYFAWKKKKYETAEGSAVPRKLDHQDDSVVMVEMRSSASEL